MSVENFDSSSPLIFIQLFVPLALKCFIIDSENNRKESAASFSRASIHPCFSLLLHYAKDQWIKCYFETLIVPFVLADTCTYTWTDFVDFVLNKRSKAKFLDSTLWF